MRIAGTVNDSIVDGPGLRFTVFTQGCRMPARHTTRIRTKGGHDADTDDLIAKMKRTRCWTA